MKDKVTGQCPQTTTFLKRKESQSGFEPRSLCLPAQRLTARPNRLTGLGVSKPSIINPLLYVLVVSFDDGMQVNDVIGTMGHALHHRLKNVTDGLCCREQFILLDSLAIDF